ncbi:protein-tyrosine phosphatase-like protein [Mycena amicta]|nr:protein-tyrosine phosphatase-like protein [Mycena amicta]
MAASLASLASQNPLSAYNLLKFGPSGSPARYGPFPADQLLLLEARRRAAADTWWPCEALEDSPRTLGPCGGPDESLREQLAAAMKDHIPLPQINGVPLKTSANSPLRISAILPLEYVSFISQLLHSSERAKATIFDLEPAFTLDRLLMQRPDHPPTRLPPPPPPPPKMLVAHPASLRDALQAALTSSVDSSASPNTALSLTLTVALDEKSCPPRPDIGNLFLSSCPGKKVRLQGPVKGRSGVCRDLNVDLARIKQLGVGCIICCLDDTELSFLGAPWHLYEPAARAVGISILRIPIPEGLAPASPASLDAHLTRIIDTYTLRGVPVLVHCRGGVGRAGVVACCWLLKLGLSGWLKEGSSETLPGGVRPDTIELVERVIGIARRRRSIKAVETVEQVQFLVDFVEFLELTPSP